jgi:predicted aconitase
LHYGIDIKEAVNYLTRPLEDPIIVLGCPHLSLNEIAEITRLVKGKNMKNKLWLFTSRGVYAQADREGYTKVIETAGGKIFRDTCMVVAPLKDMGWREVATNSFKAAHYMTNMGMETKIDTIQGLLMGSCL